MRQRVIYRRRASQTNTVEPGAAYIFAFPFWIYTDQASTLAPVALRYQGARVRIYPPFRSAPANFAYLPAVECDKIPLLEGAETTCPEPEVSPMITLPMLAEPGSSPSVLITLASEWQQRPRMFPMDSMRVDVLVAPAGGFSLNLFMNDLLDHLRILTGQWWINQAIWPIASGLLRYRVPISEEGTLLFKSCESHSVGRTMRGTEQPVDDTTWGAVACALEEGDVPSVVRTLLCDAQYQQCIQDWRGVVLDASAAAEIAKDRAYERAWRQKYGAEEPFKRGRVLKGYNLGRHVSVALERFVGRSFQNEQPESFQAIQELWSARNNVAHGGRAEFTRGDTKVPVMGQEASSLIAGAESLVAWLADL